VLADDPQLGDRSGRARRRPLLRVVLDSQLRTPLESQMVATAANDVVLVCAAGANHSRELALVERGVEVLRLGSQDGRIRLPRLLEELHRRRVLSVLVEAGTAVNGSFLRDGLVDKVVLYYAESELGSGAMDFAEGVGSPYVLQQRLSRPERMSFPHGEAEDARVSGYLRDPWE
jgi:diaminohydroxyphosphoribosylaminopyrimidine deaminase/5-amino-6-(5-phosphoribosylamino)uracil reductase